MGKYLEKSSRAKQESKSPQLATAGKQSAQLKDQRPETSVQLKLSELSNSGDKDHSALLRTGDEPVRQTV